MKLNTLSPAAGSRQSRKRVGRGIGSGLGKTCGKGHKGQKSRAGGFHKINFEGGQMPLQMRLPKIGFTSRVGRLTDQVTLSELDKIEADNIDMQVLRDVGLINSKIKSVKVFLSGKITKAVKLKGIKATKGAREKIEAAGGSIED